MPYHHVRLFLWHGKPVAGIRSVGNSSGDGAARWSLMFLTAFCVRNAIIVGFSYGFCYSLQLFLG
jgi:hypothetical protein